MEATVRRRFEKGARVRFRKRAGVVDASHADLFIVAFDDGTSEVFYYDGAGPLPVRVRVVAAVTLASLGVARGRSRG